MRYGDIIVFSGALPVGSNPDNIIFRRGLKNLVLLEEVVIADDGYTYSPAVAKDEAIGFYKYHSQKGKT